MKPKTKDTHKTDRVICVRLAIETHKKMKTYCAQHDVSIRRWLAELIEKNLS